MRQGLGVFKTETQPVFMRRHSEAELRALTEQAREFRRKMVADASRGSGPQIERARVWNLAVTNVVRETDAATSLFFERPADFQFLAGQFLTLHVEVGGKEYRRAYSIFTAPQDPHQIGITVKRVSGGVVSNHLVDATSVGNAFRCVGPSGVFTGDAQDNSARVFVAAGSGITPVMSQLSDLSARAEKPATTLIYGSTSPSDMIFRQQLANLQAQWPELRVRLCFDRCADAERSEFESGEVHVGRLDAQTLAAMLAAEQKGQGEATYFVCGPAPVMDAAAEVLAARGVKSEQIKIERFVSPTEERSDDQTVHSVRFAKSNIFLQIPANRSILDAALDAGVPMNFSCGLGGCAACKVHVLSGTVVTPEPNCLTEQEKACNACLPCIARATSAVVLDA